MLSAFTTLELLAYFLPKLFVATVCGAIIGLERELKGKSAGLKTNITICVGSTLFTAVSILLYALDTTTEADVNRTIAQVVSGIGFLGAGAIIKDGASVQGLTTASIIWLMGAIGVLVGAEGYYISIIISFGFLAVTILFDRLERKLHSKKRGRRVKKH